MSQRTDHELLADFARSQSEDAFAELVARYVNLVYSTALRSTGNAHHAEEITQAVFIILTRKAAALPARVVLSGWLYQTTRFTAANFLKAEIRRQRREQEAYMQSTLNDPSPAAWEQIAPLLEDAMGHLGETDRNAVVLRFFQNKTAAESASVLCLTEAAVHKRTNRALHKLRKVFCKHGITSTTSIIAGAISAHSIQPAPAAAVRSVKLAAAAKGAAASASKLILIQGALKLMAWTKAKTATVVVAGVLLAAGTTTITVRQIQEHRAYPWEVPQWNAKLLEQAPPQVRIVPARFPPGGMGVVNGKIMGIGQPLSNIFPHAYGVNWTRTLCKVQLPSGNYDFIANLPDSSAKALQREIEQKFRLKTKLEVVQTDVLVLTVQNPGASGLKPAASPALQLDENDDHFGATSCSLSNLCDFLESFFHVPVTDGTGLTQRFDINFKWNRNDPQNEDLKRALLEQLGLELVPSREPLEMLVVEKAI